MLADCGFQAFAPLDQPNEHDPAIIVDDNKTFQTIEGFGGAFTDAAATVFGKLAQNAQEKFLKAFCNLTARDTFLRVWRRGQFVKYQCPPNGTMTFVLQPT